ncbi:MAG: PQQ-binding-like beta-propeller repeat protein [Candidatus Latescibacteria bacterium]|nr:PQQ-binding-like beta-propeller repeat protein [Candidatus Latescibacterota bacterium]
MTLRWRTYLKSPIRTTPLVADSVVVVASLRGVLSILDRTTGKQLATYRTDGSMLGTPVLRGTTAIVASSGESSALKAVNVTHRRSLWKRKLGEIGASLLVRNDTLVIALESGGIQTLHVETGEPIWIFKTDVPVRATPLVLGDTLIVGADRGHLYALSLSDSLNVIYRTKLDAGIYASPVAGNDSLFYVGTTSGTLSARLRRSGEEIWSFRTDGGIYAAPTLIGDTLYTGSLDRKVYALNARTGFLLWAYETEGVIRSSPSIVGRIVYIGSDDRTIYGIDRETGHVIWRYPTGGPVRSSPTVTHEGLYIGSDDGYLYAFQHTPAGTVAADSILTRSTSQPATLNSIPTTFVRGIPQVPAPATDPCTDVPPASPRGHPAPLPGSRFGWTRFGGRTAPDSRFSVQGDTGGTVIRTLMFPVSIQKKNDRWKIFTAFGVSLFSATTALIIENAANRAYETYHRSAGPSRQERYYRRAVRYDRVSGGFWILFEVGFTATWYFAFF